MSANSVKPEADKESSGARTLRQTTTKTSPGCGCECLGDGLCVHCGGKGVVKFERVKNLIFDEEFGWISDPDAEEGISTEIVTEKCHMCENGVCRICRGLPKK